MFLLSFSKDDLLRMEEKGRAATKMARMEKT